MRNITELSDSSSRIQLFGCIFELIFKFLNYLDENLDQLQNFPYAFPPKDNGPSQTFLNPSTEKYKIHCYTK